MIKPHVAFAFVVTAAATLTIAAPAPASPAHPTAHQATVAAAHRGGQYAFLVRQPGHPGQPVRWNGCDPITWSFAESSSAHRALTRGAFNTIAQPTGFTFRETQPSKAVIKLDYRRVAGDLWGYGGFHYSGAGEGALLIPERGYVHVERGHVSRELLLHEIGHAVGLAHVSSPREVMHPGIHGQNNLGPGDIAGLHKLGRSMGCVEAPHNPTNVRLTRIPAGLRITWTQPGHRELITSTVVEDSSGVKATARGSATSVILPASVCYWGTARIYLQPKSPYGSAWTRTTLRCPAA